MPRKPDELLRFIQEEIDAFHQTLHRFPDLFRADLNLHPIPFFGDILEAEIVTLALNPAWNEFEAVRNWPGNLGARGLANRLIHYFDLVEAEPHPFFEKWHPALSLLGRSYQCGVAHIDLLPHPTLFPGGLVGAERAAFSDLVGQALKSLRKVLGFCREVKLIIVIDYTFSVPDGGDATTFDFLATQFPPFAERLQCNGDLPPIFRGGGLRTLTQRVRQHRQVLRDRLQTARVLAF